MIGHRVWESTVCPDCGRRCSLLVDGTIECHMRPDGRYECRREQVGCISPEGEVMRGHFGPCEQAGHRPIYVTVEDDNKPGREERPSPAP